MDSDFLILTFDSDSDSTSGTEKMIFPEDDVADRVLRRGASHS
jgi:hypothetical protein